jgi:hypothetical protein
MPIPSKFLFVVYPAYHSRDCHAREEYVVNQNISKGGYCTKQPHLTPLASGAAGAACSYEREVDDGDSKIGCIKNVCQIQRVQHVTSTLLVLHLIRFQARVCFKSVACSGSLAGSLLDQCHYVTLIPLSSVLRVKTDPFISLTCIPSISL